MVGIDKTLATVSDVRELLMDGVALVKAGNLGLGSAQKAIEIAQDLYKLAMDAQGAMPELKDLDVVESARLTAAVYSAVRDVMVAMR